MEVFKGRAYYIKGPKDILVEERKITAKDKIIIKITRGGICGSDLNYYFNGGVGDLKLQHPMLLGHEVIGHIAYIPDSISGLKVGQKVAVNPSLSCKACYYCLAGKPNQCLDIKFFGSAMRNPHIHGGFADYLEVEAEQCIPYDQTISNDIMCFAEPLAVAIHAVNQARNVVGKKVLVSGAGPIGCLVIAAARACGAAEIIALDISQKSREIALLMGADAAFDPTQQDFESFKLNKGSFDIAFDATGVAQAIKLAIQVTKPTGIIIQIGNTHGLLGLPIIDIISKELTLRGTFRFNEEFLTSVNWLEKGRINPLPLLSHKLIADKFEEAILIASDKNVATKVQLIFDE